MLHNMFSVLHFSEIMTNFVVSKRGEESPSDTTIQTLIIHHMNSNNFMKKGARTPYIKAWESVHLTSQQVCDEWSQLELLLQDVESRVEVLHHDAVNATQAGTMAGQGAYSLPRVNEVRVYSLWQMVAECARQAQALLERAQYIQRLEAEDPNLNFYGRPKEERNLTTVHTLNPKRHVS